MFFVDGNTKLKKRKNTQSYQPITMVFRESFYHLIFVVRVYYVFYEVTVGHFSHTRSGIVHKPS